MDARVQIFTTIIGLLLVILVVDLVRRRRLGERYALLWLFSATAILALSLWQGLLDTIATVIGIAYPPNALFLVAVLFILLLLLNISVALTRLQNQTRILAQHLAILEADRCSRTEKGQDD